MKQNYLRNWSTYWMQCVRGGKMQTLILVKHSLPEIVEDVPAHAWELSSEGRTRVGKLAEKLKQYQPEVIVSSIEPKARQTAELICEKLGVDVVVMDGLHEHDRSSVPFYSNDKFQSRIQELFEEPDVVFEEQADIFYTVFEEGDAFDAHSECKAGIFFTVNSACFQYCRIDHSATEHLKPASILAYIAPLAPTYAAAYIHLCRWLRKREI